MKVALDLDLESLGRDDLQYPLTQGCLGDKEGDLDLERPFAAVKVEETVEDLTLEQVRRVVDLRDYGPSAEIDIENPNDLQQE